MIISHSRRFIVFSNPKTGSESLRALLAPYADERVRPWRERSSLYPFYPHMSPAEARKVFRARGWDFDSYVRVTCIRNPYPRLVSLYRMIDAVDGLWKLRNRAGLGVPDFSQWLLSSRASGRGGGGRPHQRWRRFGAWSVRAWAYDQSGHSLVTHILRLERLGRDLPAVLQDLGLDPKARLPGLNRRPATDWRDWYTPSTMALVADRYAWDLQHFYKMPGIAPSQDIAA